MGIHCSHVLATCIITNINNNQHVVSFFRASELMKTWEPEFFYFWDMETLPQNHGPTFIPDTFIYMVEKGRRKYIRIRNEMDELSQPKHTYICRKCGQQCHSRRTCTSSEKQLGISFKLLFTL
jgi:hypothetical protein